MSFLEQKEDYTCLCMVDDINMAGKKQNLDPMWKIFVKDVDLREPTSFLDSVYLGCTPRECKTSKDTVDNYRSIFESVTITALYSKVVHISSFRLLLQS